MNRSQTRLPGALAPRSVAAALLLGLAILAAPLAAGTRIVGVEMRGHVVHVEVVSTPDTMRTGLMFRNSLDADHGMLFVYPRPQPLSFWMKNTRLPLSIAFITKAGVILNTEDMTPFDEKTLHVSKGDALYALEVNQGWFRERKIVAGDRVRFLKTVVADEGPPR